VESEALVSIVIPVYNVRDYVEQCLDSILAQTYQNIEVLVVLDAPTDGSNEICKRYAARDSRIKVINQKVNGGVTRAWKRGVEEASGEYLGFVDADDFIEPDMYQRMMECRKDFDMVVTRWIREDGPKTRVAFDPLALGAYRSEEEMTFLHEHLISIFSLESRCPIRPGLAGFLWNKLFKTPLAQEVFKQVDGNIRVFSDPIFLFFYAFRCKSVLLTDICGYHYRIRQNSISHTRSFIRNLDTIRPYYNALRPVFEAHPSHDVLLKQLDMRVSNWLLTRSGFSSVAQGKKLVFPFLNLLDGKSIALCGAGSVGQSYYRLIQSHQVTRLALWVDSNWEYRRKEGWPISPVEELRGAEYDCVVIAAYHKEAAEEIKIRLISLGIEEDKLLWKPPLVL